MHHNTKKKILYLQSFLPDWIQVWSEAHPDNITGFRIDRKKKGKKTLRNYSIVFQVAKKRKVNSLSDEEVIPPFLEIPFPDGVVRKIATDVIETGKGSLQIGECRKPLSTGNVDFGTVGAFLTDAQGRLFALTNYHVAAWERMLQNNFSFAGSDTNIYINGSQSDFIDGIFSDQLDIAFIEVAASTGVSNQLAPGVTIDTFLTGPYGPQFIGRPATVYCLGNPPIRNVRINNNAASWNTQFRNIFIHGLLSFPRVTVKGNSGSPIMMGTSIIGIIIGADNLFSYAIPYYKIYNYNPHSFV